MYTDDYIIELVIKGLQLRGLIFSSWSWSKLICSDLYCSLLCHQSIIGATSSLTPLRKAKKGKNFWNLAFRGKIIRAKLRWFIMTDQLRGMDLNGKLWDICKDWCKTEKRKREEIHSLRKDWVQYGIKWELWVPCVCLECPVPTNESKPEASPWNPSALIPQRPDENPSVKNSWGESSHPSTTSQPRGHSQQSHAPSIPQIPSP